MTTPGTSSRVVADLHLHSRYSMATSPALDPAALAEAGRAKGVDLLSTADFTHPGWRRDLAESLEEVAPGLFALRGAGEGAPRFVLGTEVSCVWRQDDRGRRVHLLLFAPGFDAVERICDGLEPHGSLKSDGRPLLRLSARDLAELVWDADPRCEVVPAHVWTPWYGLYGSKSGFDSFGECFGDLAPRVRAIETGLSSDPAMNWRVPELDGRALLSFSDAHSARTVARELTVFEMQMSYDGLRRAIAEQSILETIEFFPENGKYHLDGHRKCGVRLRPAESARRAGRCPECGRALTLGVLSRVEELAARPDAADTGHDGLVSGPPARPPFRRLVPLRDLAAGALGVGVAAKRAQTCWNALVNGLGSELAVLVDASAADIERIAGDAVAEAVMAARQGNVDVESGYDGVYGSVTPRAG